MQCWSRNLLSTNATETQAGNDWDNRSAHKTCDGETSLRTGRSTKLFFVNGLNEAFGVFEFCSARESLFDQTACVGLDVTEGD